MTGADRDRSAAVSADVRDVTERAGPDGAEAACRAAFAELLHRYGDASGVFSWDGTERDNTSAQTPPAVTIELTQAGDRVTGTISLRGDDLAAVLPGRAAAHYLTLLDRVLLDRALLDRALLDRALLAQADVLTAAERQEIAVADGEPLDTAALRPWPELVAGHAARTPEAVAVRYEDLALSYGQLDRRANQLAALLRAGGAGPRIPVALCLPRSASMVVAVLGVLKAGAHYVPVDPADPAARRAEIIGDCSAMIVVTADSTAGELPDGVTAIQLDVGFSALDGQPDSPPGVPLSADDPAYLLYTSGSTGRPKGVVVEHRQLAAYVAAMVARFGIDRPRSYALVQPLSVDSSVTALAIALATGGEVHVLARERALDAEAFADWMRRYHVDCLKIAPSHLRALQGSPLFPRLLPSWLLIAGGEASSWDWLRELQRAHPRLRVVNHYGPTETTVGVLTLAVAEHMDAQWGTAPIGTALPGTTVTVVDPDGREAPVGIAGELVIGGAQVARGYHGTTEESGFTGTEAGRCYRTGDRARRLPGGIVAFLGRDDDQVKLNGFRVELGEIDAALAAHPAVRQAATVLDRSQARIRVVAYVVPGDVDTAALREHLRVRLPPHMVPAAIVGVARLPLTPHGKLDRGALALLALDAPAGFVAHGPASDAGLEQVVTAVWRDLLGVDAVGPEQNFFDVGGHSLLLVELQDRLTRATGSDVDVLDLLQHPTVRAQAELLAGESRPQPPPPRRSPVQAALARRRQQWRGTQALGALDGGAPHD